MKRMQLILTLVTLALASANAATHYNLKLATAQWAGDKQLNPGDYKLEIIGDKAVFTTGKSVIEVPAAIQKSDRKFSGTSYHASDSKIVEIDLGGTNTKIVFEPVSSGAAAGRR